MKHSILLYNSCIALFICLAVSATGWAQTDTISSEYSQELLKSFAEVHEEVLSTQRFYRRKMMAAVDETGLSPDTFSDMLNYQKDVTADDSDYTAAEKKAFTEAIKSLMEIQEELDDKLNQLVRQAGLSMAQYNQMATRYEQSKEMRKKVKNLRS